jgi:hypothetical protein
MSARTLVVRQTVCHVCTHAGVYESRLARTVSANVDASLCSNRKKNYQYVLKVTKKFHAWVSYPHMVSLECVT